MKKELSPAVTWTIIIVLVVAVLGVGFTMFRPKAVDYDKKGSDDLMKKVGSGGKLYDPPGRVDGSGKFVPPGMGGTNNPMTGR